MRLWIVVLMTLGGAACASGPRGRAQGTREVTLMDQDVSRTALLHEPAARFEGPRPLIVVLHGGASDAAEMERVTGFSRIADREGLYVAYPDGLGVPGLDVLRAWNPGECCSRSYSLGIDDAEFLKHFVRALRERLPVDGRRIYLVGYSNGGALAYRVALAQRYDFAAVGIFAALPSFEGPLEPEASPLQPTRPVALVAIHSLRDRRVPYDQRDSSGRGPSFEAAGRAWGRWLHCGSFARTEDTGALFVERARGCPRGGDVLLVTLKDWTHEWPGPENYRALGAPQELVSFDAAERMWGFFKAHVKDGPRTD